MLANRTWGLTANLRAQSLVRCLPKRDFIVEKVEARFIWKAHYELSIWKIQFQFSLMNALKNPTEMAQLCFGGFPVVYVR